MLKFLKMEGIGNDYVYFDGINQNVPTDETFIKKVSNRHIGIGSDGVIIILPSETCDFRMRMFNLDGSEGKICGKKREIMLNCLNSNMGTHAYFHRVG